MAKKIPSKKSSPKKAVKKAVKKAAPRTAPKKPSIVDEAREEFSHSVPETPYRPETITKKQDNKRFPIVVIVLLVIGVIVFLNYLNKKKTASKETAPAVVEDTAKFTESGKSPEKPVVVGFNKEDWGTATSARNWNDAKSFCEGKGMKLPSKDELIDYQKNASKDLKTASRFWTSTPNEKDYETIFMKTGDAKARPAAKKYKVICKK